MSRDDVLVLRGFFVLEFARKRNSVLGVINTPRGPAGRGEVEEDDDIIKASGLMGRRR